MKRVLTMGAVLGIASMALLFGTPTSVSDPHKILWCHYPPGQWTGVRADSKVIILDIDVASTEDIEKLTNKHIGHSPIIPGQPPVFAEGPASEMPNGECPGTTGGGGGGIG